MIYGAIDGGGTGSRILIKNEKDEILFSNTGHSTNIYSVGKEKALENLLSLISSYSHNIDSLCIGSAGLGREKEILYFKEEIKKKYPNTKLYITNDIETLLVGAIDGLSGCALISGTGSIAMARLNDGSTIRKGGFGWRLGDEGSAWYIADQAVKRALKSTENREIKSLLPNKIVDFFNLKNISDIIPIWNNKDVTKEYLSSFSIEVYNLAKKGDILSNNIMNDASQELFNLLNYLFIENKNLIHNPILLSGSILKKNEIIRNKVISLIKKKNKDANIVIGSNKALEGALKIASSI